DRLPPPGLPAAGPSHRARIPGPRRPAARRAPGPERAKGAGARPSGSGRARRRRRPPFGRILGRDAAPTRHRPGAHPHAPPADRGRAHGRPRSGGAHPLPRPDHRGRREHGRAALHPHRGGRGGHLPAAGGHRPRPAPVRRSARGAVARRRRPPLAGPGRRAPSSGGGRGFLPVRSPRRGRTRGLEPRAGPRRPTAAGHPGRGLRRLAGGARPGTRSRGGGCLMRRTAAFVVHELRTQGRSLRFRVAAVAYVAAGSLPAALTYVRRSGDMFVIGGATYAKETMGLLPLLTGALAILLSLDGIGRERSSGAWTTLALTDLTNAGYLFRRWIALLA